MTDEWGPWIEHDGKGCPCVGKYVEVEHYHFYHGEARRMIIPCVNGENGWDNRPNDSNVIRYRIRKPRGMAILESILTDLPMPTERVDA